MDDHSHTGTSTTAHTHDNDRGISTPLSHVFSLAITGVLVVLVLVTASGHLETQRERAAEEELQTIGNRLATELERIDELGRQGGDVNTSLSHPESVAGNPYSVSLESGTACETPLLDAKQCLVLESSELGVTERVPVNLSTSVELRQPTGGTIRVDAAGDASSPAAETARLTGSAPDRLGIGNEFSLTQFGTVESPLNRPPVAQFEFSPGNPTTASPVEFSATPSRDVDGDIASYAWAINSSTYSETGENISVSLGPGMHNVTLRVIDDDGGRSNVTRTLWVSGLEYNGDMSSFHYIESGARNESIRFTVRNTWTDTSPDHVEITEIMVDPRDSAIDRIEVPDLGDAGSDGDDDNSETELLIDPENDGLNVKQFHLERKDIPNDGSFVFEIDGGVEIDNPVLGTPETAEFRLRGFEGSTGEADMGGEQVTVGLRYRVDGQRNVTTFTDVIGGPDIESFDLLVGGPSNQEVDARINASKELGTPLDVTLGGSVSGSLDAFDFAYQGTNSKGNHVYRADDINGGATGTIKANLTRAVEKGGDGTESGDTVGDKSINRSAVVLSTSYAWQSASDWDSAQRSDRVVHASYGTLDDATVSLGYPTADQGGNDLVGYWHMDEQTAPADVSSENNDGSVAGDPTEDLGVFGRAATNFDGSDDHIEVPNDASLETDDTDEVTVSAWVKKGSDQSGWVAILQHSDQSYNLQFDDGEEPEFTIYDGGWYSAATNDEVTEDRWYHLVGTFSDGDGVRLYRDGTLIDTNYSPDEIEGTTDPVGIASNLDTGSRHLDGSVDEVRVYDRALSEAEVDRLYKTAYNGTLGTDWKSGPSLDPSKLQVVYDASVPAGTRLNATVLVDTDGDGNADDQSDVAELANGAGTVDVTGLSTSGTRYRVLVTFNSTSPVNAPELDAIGLNEA